MQRIFRRIRQVAGVFFVINIAGFAVWLILGSPVPDSMEWRPEHKLSSEALMAARLERIRDNWDMPLDQRRRMLWPIVRRLSQEANVDPALIMGMVAVESRFRPWAVSPAGAMGLMQLTPTTALHLGLEAPHQALDPVANLRAGIKYIVDLIERFDGDTRMALAAYNAGPTAVRRFGGVPPIKETRNYISRVIKEQRRFSSKYQTIAAAQ